LNTYTCTLNVGNTVLNSVLSNSTNSATARISFIYIPKFTNEMASKRGRCCILYLCWCVVLFAYTLHGDKNFTNIYTTIRHTICLNHSSISVNGLMK